MKLGIDLENYRTPDGKFILRIRLYASSYPAFVRIGKLVGEVGVNSAHERFDYSSMCVVRV